MTTRFRETVPFALNGQRVDRVVSLLTGLARREVAELVANGGVTVEGRTVGSRSQRIFEGDELEVTVPTVSPIALEPEPALRVPAVYTDSSVIVVDKPAGLVVHPGSGNRSGTLVNALLAEYPDIAGVGDPTRPGIVHRLDAGTSGLLAVARTAAAYESLVDQLRRRTVERRYLALTWGAFDANRGLVDAPVGRDRNHPTRMAVSAAGRPSRTRYEVQARYSEPAEVTLVECVLETGRTHQIRVHLAAIGHPVVGDATYGGDRPPLRPGRPYLHAYALAFDHPVERRRRRFESPLATDLEEFHAQLR